MKRIEDEFAETRKLAVAPPANKIKMPYGYCGSVLADINNLGKMYIT